MSLDQRCQLFHEAAAGSGSGKSKGPVKEIATLRKFLHKNQDQRFTDKAVSRLFDTVQIYVTNHNDDVSVEMKEGLLEDCLKLPFNVFTTKQKQKMIKWLEDLRGGGGGDGGTSATADGQDSDTTVVIAVLSVIDVSETTISLMNDDTGDTYDVDILSSSCCSHNLVNRIKSDFETTENAISVKCNIMMRGDHDTVITKIIGIVNVTDDES